MVPAAAINPLTIADQGGLELLGRPASTWSSPTPRQLPARGWPRAGVPTPMPRCLDLQDPPGREVQRRHADDRRRRRVQLQDCSPTRRARRTPCPSSAASLSPDGVEKVDSSTVAFHLEAPNASFPYAGRRKQLQHDHRPEQLRLRRLAEVVPRYRPFMKTSYTPNVGRDVRAQPALLGDQGAAVQASISPSTRTKTPMIRRAPGGAIDAIGPVLRGDSPQLLSGNYNVISAQGEPPTASCPCATTWPRSRTSSSARRSPSPWTGPRS